MIVNIPTLTTNVILLTDFILGVDIVGCELENDYYCPENNQTVIFKSFEGCCQVCIWDEYRQEEEDRRQQELNDLLALQEEYEREKVQFDHEWNREMKEFEKTLGKWSLISNINHIF